MELKAKFHPETDLVQRALYCAADMSSSTFTTNVSFTQIAVIL